MRLQRATAQECAEKYNIPAGTIRSWVSRSKNNKNSENNKRNVASKDETVAKRSMTAGRITF
jgi:uncharacterized protein YjcR